MNNKSMSCINIEDLVFPWNFIILGFIYG